MRQHVIRMALGLAVLAVFLLNSARIYDLRFIQQLEFLGYDARLRLTMPNTPDPRIVIIDIDEKSLAEEGRWPWGRDRLALLLDKLFGRYGVKVAGFDVVFAEADQSSGMKILERLGREDLKTDSQFQSAFSRIRPQLDHDLLLAQKLKQYPVALGYYFTSHEDAAKARTSGMLPSPVFPSGAFDSQTPLASQATGYGANLKELQQHAVAAGHFNPVVDFDGVTRRIPMLIEYRGGYYESLALAVSRIFLDIPHMAAEFSAEGGDGGYSSLEWLMLGKLKIPVDEIASALVPYRGTQGSFKYISASDILRERINPAELKGKIALLGTTAPGLMDLRSTPVSAVYPGVEIHANMIAGILDQNIKQKPAYMLAVEVLTLFVCGLLLALLLPLLNPFKSSLLVLLVLLVLLASNLAAWQSGIVLAIASPVAMIAILYGFNMSYGFFVESRAKKKITGLFGQYVPPELVEKMSRDPERFTMEGESREMTVLFSDVRNFTTISEKLDPKQLSRLMNEYLTPMTQIIHKHQGTIDKYIGDAIMAFWGAPLPDAEHARHALLAGMEMQQTLQQMAPNFKERGWPELKIGIGINTGMMNVGNMGSEFRLAYTVLGDAVNLASRLEGLTKQYGADIIIGETTRQAAAEVVFRELDKVRVKGKLEPVSIYEPVGMAGEVDEKTLAEISRFHAALNFYRGKDWQQAEQLLLKLQQDNPDSRLYSLYLERIAHFRANPPSPDWDGVMALSFKA